MGRGEKFRCWGKAAGRQEVESPEMSPILLESLAAFKLNKDTSSPLVIHCDNMRPVPGHGGDSLGELAGTCVHRASPSSELKAPIHLPSVP